MIYQLSFFQRFCTLHTWTHWLKRV